MSKAAATRLIILQKAFGLVYRNGFQATSIDEIIASTEVTKGAFFYHFKNKDEMGLAMIHEVMVPGMQEVLIKPLQHSTEPVTDLYAMMKHLLLKAPFFQVKYGCPAVNLVEEMSPLNPSFHQALNGLFSQWQSAIQTCISNGKHLGKIKKEVDPHRVACFIMAGYGGIRNMGKLAGINSYQLYLKELQHYLKQLS